jgi:hypothetical protein
MSISIRKVSDDLYFVSVIAPQSRGGDTWSPAEPLGSSRIVQELFDRGFHQQDIGDAMQEADQMWIAKSRD